MPEKPFDAAGITDGELWKLQYLRRLKAVDHHLNFIAYTWKNASDPFVVGHHTREICTCIDEAIENYSQGISTFWVVTVPFRHGKSEIISRKLPAHFLGLFPDSKVILCGHTSGLTEGFSEESRDLIKTPQYRDLFPAVSVNRNDASAIHWSIEGREGECFACGITGSMAGQGGNLLILDDFCRGRAEAESATIRERTWNAFTNDFMTRRAPVSIVFVLATRWHTDDVIGRIENKMREDPAFPKFVIKTFPAFNDDYPSGTLFPERFDKSWYDEQRATMGEYGTASLLQCAPTARGGNILRVDNVKKVPLTQFPDIQYSRVWDLAHTEKERNSPDPDYTSGTLLAFRRKPGAPRQWELWIKDVKRFRYDAPKRDNQILNTTVVDGPYVKVGIEQSLDSKDSFRVLQNILIGQRIVQGIKGKGDKVVRASALEPIFEAGDVYVAEGAPWYQAWIDELSAFPSGPHDDQVDNLSAGFLLYNKSQGVVSVPLYGVR
jgi:predicted phage terminase large subunit-like protein